MIDRAIIQSIMSSPETSEIKAVPASKLHAVHFGFQNTYSHLPERFFARVDPTPVSAPRLVKVNEELCQRLGIDANALRSDDGIAVLAGNRVAAGSEPLAEAYAGHQFGNFVPQLGDGRANLLGEVIGVDGIRYDLQLKGSGRTPFSRGGDGRAALGPVLREYIVSEAMAALGIPTTRALAAVTTGDRVIRERVLPGAVLTRVAASHIRVGTFEFFAARQDTEALRVLANFASARHYPGAAQAQKPYRAFLDGIIGRQAKLVAQWMLIGFIHGVMNTDNTSISGETIDYGPCAFMEAYDPATVFSAIDQFGRYAYGNQPRIALWNLTRLAEALLPMLVEEEGSERGALDSANAALRAFAPQYESAHLSGMRRKLGLTTECEGDKKLAEDLLQRMYVNRADFTLTFSRLCDAAVGPEGDSEVRSSFAEAGSYDAWTARWRDRLKEESISGPERAASMRRANPVIIPRNHIVEAALNAAIERQDYQPFEELLDAVTRPYDDRPNIERYKAPASPEEYVSQTFCGT